MQRIIFMGTPDYADEILKKLIAEDGMEVVAVFTQPDKPVGRKKVMTPPPVKVTAQANGIKVYQPISLKKEDHTAAIKALEPDFIIVAAFGQILPKEILDIAPCINLHASILPAYRGASPIQQSLLNGDAKTGVTAMLMDVGMDTGDIITVKEFDIPQDMLAFELFDALTNVAARMTPEVIKNYQSFQIVPQDDAQATYCKKISKSDGEVIFDDAQGVYNRYRAFTPWPGIYLPGGLKLKKIALKSSDTEHNPGEILAIADDHIEVGCAKGSLEIYAVQPPSKKEMDIKSYINGQRLNLADTLA